MGFQNKLLVILLFWQCPIYGQITITDNDMPEIGDTIRTSLAIDLTGFNYEETGQDFTWDFSGLMPLFQQVDTFVSVTSTPILY